MTEVNTIGTLKYLPIVLTLDYFESLPDAVIIDMFDWFHHNEANIHNYGIYPTTIDKAYYIYDTLWANRSFTTYSRLAIQLEYYIKNSNYE